jgi:phthiocerol/phenolphthiocerol synthesis type-I polyketide synthase E
LFGRPGDDGEIAALRAIGTLWTRGVDVPVAELTTNARRCSLPPHPLDSRPLDREPQRSPVTTAPARDRRTSLADLWRGALGVSAVADHDDFFALGGESLMVVQMLNRLQRQTGTQVSVAEFTVEPTFRRLVELAEVTDTLTGVVRLAEGTGAPLFLMADVCGTTAGYRTVAAATGRPVFGIESTTDCSSIEDIAAAHIEVLRASGHEGLYLLGGWSFGAVVAHEMARQLGHVRHLLLLDGYVPPGEGRWSFQLGTLRLGLAAVTGRGPLGRLTSADQEVRARVLANLRAVRRHRPQRVSVSASLFKANCDAAHAERLARRLNPLYGGGLRVHAVGGDHWSMLRSPHAEALAARLRREIELAEPTRELSTL